MSNSISALTFMTALAAVALTGCDSDQATTTPPAQSSQSSTTSPTTTSSTTATTSPTTSPTSKPRLIAYAGGESVGVEVQDRADAAKLHGAPASFKRFIGRTAQRLADQATCDGAYVGVTVEVLRTDGYAAGGVNDCGGYAALWAIVDGRWKEIGGTQDMWRCRLLEKYGVPSDVAGDKCYDATTKKVRKYRQA